MDIVNTAISLKFNETIECAYPARVFRLKELKGKLEGWLDVVNKSLNMLGA